MSILDTFQKNFDSLKSDFTEYKDYHDTMITVIPSILELLDSLFLEENIKALPNYKLLKEDYLDVIKRTLDPESYRDVKFEAELPDIYDAPRSRREKAKKITKLKNQKVTTLPARITMPIRTAPTPTATNEVITNTAVPNLGTLAPTPAAVSAVGVISSKEAMTLSKALSTKIPVRQDIPKVDKALQSYAQEGKRLYNYKSPLECEKKAAGHPREGQKLGESEPEKVLVELPDETKAYLHNDGRITDLTLARQLGNIDRNGTITLNNSELGKIHLVDRDEMKFLPLTNNFGKVL